MKTSKYSYSLAGFSIGSALWLLAVCDASAQLNEDKVKRDASGVFNGKVEGGSLTIVGDSGSPPFSPPAARGRVRLRFKNGRQQGATTHPQLDGNDRVVVAGSFQRLDVKRGGKLINLKGRGTANDDSEFGLWEGNTTGTLNDRGETWTGRGIMGGLRDFTGDPMDTDDDFTERMKGFKATGSD